MSEQTSRLLITLLIVANVVVIGLAIKGHKAEAPMGGMEDTMTSDHGGMGTLSALDMKYNDCVAAGNKVDERAHPPTCTMPDGTVYLQYNPVLPGETSPSGSTY